MPADVSEIRKSLFWSVGGRYITLVLQLVSFFILARLLTPADIGLYSVAAALIGLVQVLREFGISSYLVQEKNLTEAHIRTAFTLSVILASLLCLIILAVAPFAADFYSEPRLEPVVQVLGLSFLLIPLGSTAQALLTRDMKFQALFWISTASSVISILAALVFAYYGHGYWSLVWSSVIATVVSVLGNAIAARGGLVHRISLACWRSVVAFGAKSVTGRVVAEIAMSFNDLVAGRILGMAEVGILSRAQGVMNLFHRDFIGAIRNVAYPAFAQAHREGRDIEHLHAKFVANVAAFAWPFYGLLALFPLEALRLMFGPQWDAAAPLVPIFCAAGAVGVLWSFVSSVLTATGHIGHTLRIELITQPIRLAILLWCALIYRSIEAFAWALLITYCLHTLVTYFFKQRVLPSNFPLLVVALRPSVLLALIALTPAVAVRVFFVESFSYHAPWVIFMCAGLLTAVSWIAAINWLRHPLLNDPIYDRAKSKLSRLLKFHQE